MRRAGAITGIVAAIALGLVAAEAPTNAAITTATLTKRAPGTIIRSALLATSPHGKAWKVTYRSSAVDGRDVAVSGIVFVPKRPSSKGGRPVLAWGHGTTGLADACAPSKSVAPLLTVPYLTKLLDAGYVVAATDYEGLGTPGIHPYLVGASEARSMLDAARAAKRLPRSHASNRVLLGGYSQGGHAALFAGEQASSYAPELDLLGVLGIAPVTDVEQFLAHSATNRGAGGFLVMGVEGYRAASADFDPAAVLAPQALARAEAVATLCDGALMDAFADLYGTNLLAHDLRTVPSIHRHLRANAAGSQRAGAPVLVVRGSADTVVPGTLSDAFAAKACAAGDTVASRIYDGATHTSVLIDAQDDVLEWLRDRVAGRPAPSTCP